MGVYLGQLLASGRFSMNNPLKVLSVAAAESGQHAKMVARLIDAAACEFAPVPRGANKLLDLLTEIRCGNPELPVSGELQAWLDQAPGKGVLGKAIKSLRKTL